jgi:hypothetical protein
MRGKPGPVARLALVGMILVLAYSAGRVAILEGLPRLVEALGVGATEAAIAALAVGLMVAGMVWIRRITSGEPDLNAWRWRDRPPIARRERAEVATMRPEVRRAQETGRLMLAVAIALAPLALIVFVASPGDIEPMFGQPWYVAALPWLAAAGYLVGLGWMIRIYRARPEDGERTWRYRARR